MPEALDRCVEALLSDPDFQPEDGQSREEAAYAICTMQLQESSAIADQLEKRI